MQELKAFSPIFVRFAFDDIYILVIPEHPSNALLLIFVTLSGIFIDNNFVHCENALLLMIRRVVGKLMDGKLVHPENALDPILVIFALDVVIVVKLEQF
jgi:hypothetical protein